MNEKSFASLEPTLLARKGAAKPAMRPQVAPTPVVAQAVPHIEDLGWNDMGHAEGEDVHEHDGEVVALSGASNGRQAATNQAKPEVRRQIEAIAAHLARGHASDEEQRPRGSAPKTGQAKGRRAAFTLRLDTQRHLKLRLACTIKNRSAQQIVTEALDQLLTGMPELNSLAAQLKQR